MQLVMSACGILDNLFEIIVLQLLVCPKVQLPFHNCKVAGHGPPEPHFFRRHCLEVVGLKPTHV